MQGQSAAEIQAIVDEALTLTLEINPPEHLQAAVFGKVIDMMCGGRLPAGTPITSGDVRSGSATAAPLVTLADRVSVDLDVLRDVFAYDDENGVQVILGASKLAPEKKVSTRQLALLVAGGRQLAGLEEWTPSSAIRETCLTYGRFDSGNFAWTLTQMADVFGFKGKGQQREVRLNRPGADELRALILKLANQQS